MGGFMIKENKRRPKSRNKSLATQIALVILSIWLCYNIALSWNTKQNASQFYQNDLAEDTQRSTAALTDSLSRMLLLLPDETETKQLLSPIDTTGEARLHDFGLRTRQYKILFEVWTELHTTNSNADISIRDDIPQKIRTNPRLSTALSTNPSNLLHAYEQYRSALARLQTFLFPWTLPYHADHLSLHHALSKGGRGLVFTAGTHQLPYLLTSIPILRNLGCTLPIEVLYLGPEDLSPEAQRQLESLPGVLARDLSLMISDEGWTLRGWAGKPFAILFSSFREVIFIDADALFLQNPEILFEDPEYKQTGALFFKDRRIMPEDKSGWMRKVLPAPISEMARGSRFWKGISGHMQESGVMVVDSCRHFVSLLLVTRMNGPDRDGNKEKGLRGVYDMLFGDKETFWLGWELSGSTSYAFHKGRVGTMGTVQVNGPTRGRRLDETDSDSIHSVSSESIEKPPRIQPALSTRPREYTICAPQLLHLDLAGRPLWFNGWLLQDKFADSKNQQPGKFESFVHEQLEDEKDPEKWKLHGNNVCCLSSKKVATFLEDETETLKMMVRVARRVGVFGSDWLDT
ncbi:hypothetical protein N7447_005310 [Penicillium robsamsonii]|uniref:uncharacterized protein n=1 Tax=Penicillium robsamsonii TaxID=1792511 RepID=UPI0025488811|nr:uncharacterized protein N7447_005310 [Penicillium robsamsonii]KAJ5822970.1 hypothetical protein N7447_005310 [Penicillium robsamsonii]